MSLMTKIAVGITAVSLALGATSSFAFDANGLKKAKKTLGECKQAAAKEALVYTANATVKNSKKVEWEKACDKAYK